MGTQSTWGVSASVTTMMFTILASSLVLLAAVTEGRPHENEWQTYKAIHGKEYSAEEDLMGFSRWLQNKEMVDAHNKADHGYKMALMEHSDWTEEEMNERRLGFAASPAFYDMEEDSFEDVTGPNELDHRNSESSLESAIYSVGYPISVAVHVGSSFQHYSHGVFSDPSCRYGQLNHAVLLVGYSKSGSRHYWIVKNSWGTGWGTSGYIHMKMGENSCGIANMAMYSLC